MSHLKARETSDNVDQRYRWKLRLIKSLYQRGYARQDILELFRFIDWLLALPEAMEEQLWSELKTYEEGKKMPYVTSVARIGMRKGEKKGLQRGLQQGLQQGVSQGETLILRRQLNRRFGSLPEWAEAKLAAAGPQRLESWALRILDASSLEDFFT